MLRHRQDLRPLAFNALYFATLTYAWSRGPLRGLGDATTWILIAILCITGFQGAVQNHNAVHSPVFKQRWLNKLYQVVLTQIYGHPSSSFVPGHNLGHHKATQSARDAMRTTKARFRWNVLNLIFFILQVTPAVVKGDSAFTAHMRKSHPRWFRQLLTELSVLVASSAALLWADWQRALLFWFLPHVYAQWGITTMNLLQHDGCDPKSAYNHSRNFVNPLLNWLVFNNGFHTIHHEMPGLHWSQAPAAHAAQIAPHIHPNLDQRSLLAYLFRTYGLNRRHDYLGNPIVLPPDPPDEPWIPEAHSVRDDLGVEGFAA
jgi:fatty acid desaturase